MAVPQSGSPSKGVRLMEISELAALLADRIDTLVPDLLPAAVRDGHEWRIGSIYGERGRSMAIHRGGAKKGTWKDFSDASKGGDALDLIAECRFGGDKKGAVMFAKSWLGLDGLDPSRLKQVKLQARARAKEAQVAERADLEKKMKFAKGLWLSGNKEIIGSPIDQYLLGRGIDLRKLNKLPGAIRYSEMLKYPEQFGGGEWPAMVSAIVNFEGEHVATHRTYLQQISETLVRKAPVQDAKLVVGPYTGGYIPISRGASNKSLRDAPAGDRVIICEGIEDGITLSIACPEYRVLSAISVGNFKNIRLPLAITEVVLAADNDPEEITDKDGNKKPHPARVALQAAIDYFIDQGKEVRVARAPVGKDFNDFYQAAK